MQAHDESNELAEKRALLIILLNEIGAESKNHAKAAGLLKHYAYYENGIEAAGNFITRLANDKLSEADKANIAKTYFGLSRRTTLLTGLFITAFCTVLGSLGTSIYAEAQAENPAVAPARQQRFKKLEKTADKVMYASIEASSVLTILRLVSETLDIRNIQNTSEYKAKLEAMVTEIAPVVEIVATKINTKNQNVRLA